jgi:two-component system alkaline phosphatase synthesis response regulator PhoP
VSKRILIVEDEPGLIITLRDRLRSEQYAVEVVSDGAQAIERASSERFDLILLDVTLPGASGFEVCQALRARDVRCSIIMLTARAQLTDRVIGLKIGADDYLTKPFEMAELLARIEVQLRRRPPEPLQPQDGVIRLGQTEVDLRRAELRRDSQRVPLSAKELQLLRYFLQHKGAALTRDEILNGVWGYDSAPNTRTVDVHVAMLRRKLEPDPHHPSHILTVRGMGYRFVG